MEATLSVQQVICPHCEELVHRNASSCPYCQHSFHHFQDVSQIDQNELLAHIRPVLPIQKPQVSTPSKKQSEEKNNAHITFKQVSSIPAEPLSMLNKAVKLAEQKAQPNKTQQNKPESKLEEQLRESDLQKSEQVGKMLFSLFALLAGSFFVFFALVLKLFSKNGKFVLEWSADLWPYYLFPALFLLVYGMISFTADEAEI